MRGTRGGARWCLLAGGAALGLVGCSPPAPSQGVGTPVGQDSSLEERLGDRVDLALPFTNEAGRRVTLGEYVRGDKPALLVLAYYRCPMLCGMVLRGAVLALQRTDLRLGQAFRSITVSFDPRDTPEAARRKQESTLKALAGGASRGEWPFLVGEEASSRRLAADVGFRFAYDGRTDQYAHPAAIIVLTPDGTISRYLYGVEFSPRDLRLAIVEAGDGKVGSLVDRVLLTCYRYDPARRAYGPFVVGFLRIGAGLTFLVVALIVGLSAWAAGRRATEDARP